MNTQQAIRATMDTSSLVITRYVEDLSDAELMERPGPGCNHIAWQLGHLISSEAHLLQAIVPSASIDLPEGFAAKHSKDQVGNDNPADFYSKQEYLDLFKKVHAVTAAEVDKLSEADLDQPAPENFRAVFPTVGHVVILIATHGLMHAGQFVPIRRRLNKPVVI
jgi:hypothetical protein